MANLQNISIRQDLGFRYTLADAGMDLDMVNTVIQHPALARGMVEWLRKHQNQKLFVPLDQQLANVRRWNRERQWGFTEADFDTVDVTPTEHSELVTDLVAVYLPDQDQTHGTQRTFDELCDIAGRMHPRRYRKETLQSGPNHLQLLDGIDHKPGIRRVTIDLGAHWDPNNNVPTQQVQSKKSAHAEGLAAAAHFPDWVRAMDGKNVPSIWLPGYKASILGYDHMPYLSWDSPWGMIIVASNTASYSDINRACPELLEP